MRRKITFSQKAFIFKKSGQFLILRRTKTAPRYPLFWDLPGGIVEKGESFKCAIRREIKEETGVSVSSLRFLGVQHYLKTKTPWTLTAYTGRARNEKICISWEHDRHKWVTAKQFLRLKAAAHLKKFARALMI